VTVCQACQHLLRERFSHGGWHGGASRRGLLYAIVEAPQIMVQVLEYEVDGALEVVGL
jgi:hypothetical protein